MLQITIILWLPSLLPSWAGFEISAVVLYLSLHQNVNSVFFSNHAQGNSCFTPTTVAGRTESYRINTAHAFPAQKLSQQGNPKKRDRTTLPLQLAAEFKRFHQLVSSRKIANGGEKIQGAIRFCPGESLQVIILKPKSNALPRGALLPQILKGQIKRTLHFRASKNPWRASSGIVDEKW